MEKIKVQKPGRMGLQIGVVFFVAISLLICAAYVVISQNIQDMLTKYTLQMLGSMTNQGVTAVEYELGIGKAEATALTKGISTTHDQGKVEFPKPESEWNILRLVYVDQQGTKASDGRVLDIRGRDDIDAAFKGESGVYGPYFNQEDEFVICYTAPIIRNDAVVGVLSLEKDGYGLSRLIENIKFINTGEAYIINAEGTDIAVSKKEHISWVTDQYNAKKLLAQEEDPTTRSVMELEEKGLSGETGIGTYYWDDGLCYLCYAPIPSTGWVLLSGLREEEMASMTRTTLYSSLAQSPVFIICIAVFLLLTTAIIYWIIRSFKRTAEINKKLKIIANYDPLTGTLNRHSFHTALENLSTSNPDTLACVYIDVNGLHEINNRLGHQAGDGMLKIVVEALWQFFSPDNVYRIGGDEFVVLCQNESKVSVSHKMQSVIKHLKEQGYTISWGSQWRDSEVDAKAMVNLAEEAMKLDKQRYYQENGRERQIRSLDQKLERMIREKQDADNFLAILTLEFPGVYVVDLNSDAARSLFLPGCLDQQLAQVDNVFTLALKLYARDTVDQGYCWKFEPLYDLEVLKKQMDSNEPVDFAYKETYGDWLRLQVTKCKEYTTQNRETLWIFSHPSPEQKASQS